LAKCINNAKSQQCKRLLKINNVNAYKKLARQKEKMTFKTLKLWKWNNLLFLN